MGLFDFLKKTTTNNKEKNHELYSDYPEKPYISPERNMKDWLERVSLFPGMIVDKKMMIRNEDGLLPGEILFLWWLDNKKENATIPVYFEYEYGIDGIKTKAMFQEIGYIRKTDTIESLQLHTIPELKNILTLLSLPKTGKKDVLIQRITDSTDERDIQPLLMNSGFKLTDAGAKYLHQHFEIVNYHLNKNDSVYTYEDKLRHSANVLQTYKDGGFQKYAIVGALDERICSSCGEFDGKICNVSDAKVGINFPPFHDGCRCTTIIADYGLPEVRRIKIPKTNESKNVKNITYKEYAKKYLK